MGHTLNKLLKDTFNRYQETKGNYKGFKPGFDCHGLPTELKVLENHKYKNDYVLRKKCREYAEKYVKAQTQKFKELGVRGDWDNPYKTMDSQYEKNQQKAFFDLYQKGYLYRSTQEVYWSEATQSVLANAELEWYSDSNGNDYPVDWRLKKPVTRKRMLQWFFNLEQVKDRALELSESVNWGSETYKNRFQKTLQSRENWCVSRQRVWGCPLPVFYKSNGEFLMNNETMEYLDQNLKSCDDWWKLTTDELLPQKYRGQGYQKSMETMDVWLDSGLSWLLSDTPKATVYWEGSDQHRGWFQSSFLTSVALKDQAPFERVNTHGFVLDENNTKMSKSKGNVVNPSELVKKYNPDVVRLWVLNSNSQFDVPLTEESLAEAKNLYLKLRNLVKFMDRNLFDYNPNTNPVLLAEDKELMDDMQQSFTKLDNYMLNFDHRSSVNTLSETLDKFSKYYLGTETEKMKERLYRFYPDTEGSANDNARRSAQATLYWLLHQLLRVVYPFTPFLYTEFYQ